MYKKNTITFLYTSNEQGKFKIKTISFTSACNEMNPEMKYLGVNITTYNLCKRKTTKL